MVLNDEWVVSSDHKVILMHRMGDPAFYNFLTSGAGLPVWHPTLGAPDARDPSVPLTPGEKFRSSLVKFMASENIEGLVSIMHPGVCTC